jgi:hypothetical protein
MSDRDDRSEFERRVSQALHDGSDALDGHTRSKLTQARHAALEQGVGRRGAWLGFGWRQWAPAGTVAAAVLVTMMYISQHGVMTPTDDLEMFADADVYALNADADQEPDYDFYEWAAAAGQADGDSGS